MPSLDHTPQDLIECLYQNAANHADVTCLHILNAVDGTVENITYSELWLKACGFSSAFETAGVSPGDVVLVFLNHHPDMAACFFGAMQAGAIPSFMPCPSVKQDPERYWSAHQTLFRRICPKVIVTDSLQAEQMKCYGLEDGVSSFIDVNAVEEAKKPFPPKSVDPDQVALLQHSSGTTGLKKGMALSHRAILNQIRAYASTIQLKGGDTIISWLPLYHDMGLITSLIMPLALGQTSVLMDPFQWSVRPWLLFEAIAKYDGKFVWMPNFAFEHLCRTAGRMEPFADLSSVRAFINCSEPCKMDTFQRFADTFSRWGIHPEQLQACYALAENVFAVSQTLLGQKIRGIPSPLTEALNSKTIVSVGQLIPGVELKILDQNGVTLSDGKVGEIAIRGDSLFKEYFMLENITSKRIKNGYFLTLDMGFMKDAEVFILGRKDDLIIINGRNHYAHNLEALVNDVEGLKPGRSVVFGLFNEKTGSEEAVIVAERSLDAVNNDLKRTLKEKILNEADLVVRDALIVQTGWLVKTTSGKISREGNKAKYLLEMEKTISGK